MKLTAGLVRSLIKPRPAYSHKGDYGHVLVVAGSRGMPGAAALCAGGALRSGAGLVTAAVPAGQYNAVARRLRPEAMLLPLQENRAGGISARALGRIIDYAAKRRVSAVIIGPGMGSGTDTRKLAAGISEHAAAVVVIDADGINAVAGHTEIFRAAKARKARIVITPHPGEFERLTGEPSPASRGRADAAGDFAREYRLVCVLKGKGTVVTDGKTVYLNTTGNPGMATGGSGDTLAGMIGALAAQAREPAALNAAAAAVYLHGLAGDIAARSKTMAGMLAGDIIESLPAAFKKTGITGRKA